MILVYGAVCLDRIRRIESLPKAGGWAEYDSELAILGGEAANTSAALQSWGTPPRLVGNPLGADAEGDELRKRMADLGVDFCPLGPPTPHTATCDIYVSDEGDRTMFGTGFRAMAHQVHLDQIPWTEATWFTAEPNHGETALRALRMASDRGLKVYGQDFTDAALLPRLDFWQSSTDWAGRRGHTQSNVEWVRAWSQKIGAPSILSDGPNGFVLGLPGGSAQAFPPFPCPRLVDTTGAGDLFRAGMLHGLSQGWPLADCLRFASAAGALSCGGWGGTGYIPSSDEIRALIRETPDVARRYELS